MALSQTARQGWITALENASGRQPSPGWLRGETKLLTLVPLSWTTTRTVTRTLSPQENFSTCGILKLSRSGWRLWLRKTDGWKPIGSGPRSSSSSSSYLRGLPAARRKKCHYTRKTNTTSNKLFVARFAKLDSPQCTNGYSRVQLVENALQWVPLNKMV